MGHIGKSCSKGLVAIILCFVLICGSVGVGAMVASADTVIAISKTKLTLTVGSSSKLKITGTEDKVNWKSSKSSVATVSSTGNVKAKKVGKATITAKVGQDTLKCVVTVKAKTKEQKVLELVNKERKKKGLKTLKMDSKLQKAARARAKEITKKFSHTRPNGKKAHTVLKSYGVTYHVCGENIAAGQPTAKRVMSDWMNSKGHRANILYKSYTRMGVGLYKAPNKKYKYYWVQIFAD
ncbi:MAG: Ig-like domain-containing protein [Lachnospiraceae bacterium]|nr:Ig-like domain-containing protein [Lachnospiraceae bacterium]